MKKVITQKHNKIWGYEIWMYSSVPGMETKYEDDSLVEHGPLIKIIKADQALSVQVHPDDSWAKKLESEPNGKSESWYIIDALPNSELVMGIKNYDESIIRQKLNNGTFESELNKVKVTKGEFYNIPAGLIHGIGAGITIFEVQQPSNITYRYYDYDRKENGKPRELHVDKAIKVQKKLDWNLVPSSKNPLQYKNKVGSQTFNNKPTILQEKSIVVDLDNFTAYVAEKNEEINFKNYVLVSYLKHL